jgi:xeroderma pigmentosum group C-complementing protein
VDGVIPINEHGNIEVWDGLPQYVPRGAVYIEGSGCVKLAKSLGIQYAPAVTNFEMRNGRFYPKITGVVVILEHKQLIEDGMFEFTAINDEKEYQQNQKKVLDRWKTLVRSLLTRNRLREEYMR